MDQLDLSAAYTATIKDKNIEINRQCKGDGKSYDLSVRKPSKGDYWCSYSLPSDSGQDVDPNKIMAHCALFL